MASSALSQPQSNRQSPTREPPPLDNLQNNGNIDNTNSKQRKQRKTQLWKYLEIRVGIICIAKSKMTVAGIAVPKGALAIVQQEGDSHPFVQFAKPYQYITTAKYGKDKLSFSCVFYHIYLYW